MVQYEIKITGRVQGVGFRYFVVQRARDFGLTGWVKNTVDGGVMVLVQGEETEIETFCDYLRIGPDPARVDQLTKVKIDYSSVFDIFTVKY